METSLQTAPKMEVGFAEAQETFDCVLPEDLVASRITICQPTSQVEKIPQGNFYDTNSSEDKGPELNFFFLSKRDVEFEGKDFTTGEAVMVNRKEILVADEKLELPFIISLSSTGYWPLSGLMTKLYGKLKIKNIPIYSALIKATTKLMANDKGKYYIPVFTGVRMASNEEISKLAEIYNGTKPLFQEGDVKKSVGTPTKAPFDNSQPEVVVENRDEIERALDFDVPVDNNPFGSGMTSPLPPLQSSPSTTADLKDFKL